MTLEELLGSPVLFEPGTSWEYSVSHPSFSQAG